MTPSHILFCEEAQECTAGSVGNKVLGLVRLLHSGFPVPKGFCILAGAYQDHFQHDGLQQRIEENLDVMRTAPQEERRKMLAALRHEIIAQPLDPALSGDIGDALERLGNPPLAVRSSATAEDLPGHSFAGQYDTFLGVKGLEECAMAIRKCWASFWSERAFEYREQQGFHHLNASMAVLAQTMVIADVSGVLFTVDPASANHEHLLIEACFGLGEALVSGKASPDQYRLDRRNLQIVASTIPSKKIGCVLDDGQIIETSIEEERAARPCLNEAMVQSLAKMGLKIESLLGAPQDIEWSIQNGAVFLLQSRPITTLEKTWEDRQVWTNANTGEVLPDVVTPLTWAIVERLVTGMMGAIAGWVGISFDGNPIGGLVGGRVYFNINTMVGMLRRFPGLRNMDITRTLGGSHGDLKLPDEDIPALTFNPYTAMLKTPVFFVRILSRPHLRSINIISARNRRATELLTTNLDGWSEKDLAALLDSTIDELMKNLEDVAFSGAGMLWFNYLDKICRKWLGGADSEYANRLLAGFGGMDSAEAGLDLWRLAMFAHTDAEVEKSLLSEMNWETISSHLHEIPAGQTFLKQWDAFMITHGHHTRGELEFFNARWAETPEYILECVRTYLHSMDAVNPVEYHEQKGRKREDLAKECRVRLKNPVKRRWFSFVLKRSQLGCMLRENIKSAAVRSCAAIRLILLALSNHLVKRGALANRDDIFFLHLDEILSLVNNGTGIDPASLVKERRTEYLINQSVIPPSLVKGRWSPAMYIAEAKLTASSTMQGIAVSPGVVIGPARVVLRTDSKAQVLPGEILVAPFTDPGWTPYFLQAAAIVMDQGGLLSHGSIVAREFGIPAVVNVGPATKTIHTGQKIKVDGTLGIVTLFDPEKNSD